MTIKAVATTTIKVPVRLRQRIAGDAAERGVTAAAFLSDLLDRYERDQRFEQVGRAYAADGVDEDYAELTASWEQVADADADR